MSSPNPDPGSEPPVPLDPGETLRREQRRRWLAGERPPAEQLLRDHAEAAANPELALDLIFGEYLIREELGEQPSPDEYEARFPEHARAFRLQVEFDRSLNAEELGELARKVAAEGDPREIARAEDPREFPRVPGYEILGVLGRGGMGVVYRARDLGLNRLVALKMILTGGHAEPTPERLGRFRREAEAIGRLQHPHVVQVFEVGQDAGLSYLTLELAEGGSLADRLDGRPWPAQEAATLIATLARAIGHAHSRGIVHRDLKPENVLYDLDGVPKLTDFGLAKVLNETGRRLPTESGSILGTPGYMAPEQAGLTGRPVGPAADIYGLGAILYELLTGRPPFWGETPMATLQLVLFQEPISPVRLRPELSPELVTITLKCLEKDPRRRYETALELAEDLDRYVAREPIQARPLSPAAHLARWTRRHPIRALAAGLAAALLIAGQAVLVALLLQAELRVATSRELEVRAYRTLDRTLFESDRRLSALPKAGRNPELLSYRLANLNDALAAYREFADRWGDDPAYLERLAEMYRRLAAVYGQLGNPSSSFEATRLMFAALTKLAASDRANPRWRFDLALCAMTLGNRCRQAAQLDEARERFDLARTLWLGLIDDPAARPWLFEAKQPGFRLEQGLVEAERALAGIERLEHDHARALAWIEPAHLRLERLRLENPDSARLLKLHANLSLDRAAILEEASRPESAREAFETARRLFLDEVHSLQEKARSDPRSAERSYAIGRAWREIAPIEERLGRDPKAEEAFVQAVRNLAEASDLVPGNATYRQQLASTQIRLIRHRLAHDRSKQALGSAQSLRRRARSAQELVVAARELAGCIPKLPAGPDRQQAEDEALAALSAAVARGYQNRQFFNNDKRLQLIRGRPEFAKLVERLESGAAAR